MTIHLLFNGNILQILCHILCRRNNCVCSIIRVRTTNYNEHVITYYTLRKSYTLHDQVSMLSTVLSYRTLFSFIWINVKVIPYGKMHMASILVRIGFRWYYYEPYRTRLRLVRYGLSECHLKPYRTQMDTICIESVTFLV